jgi:4'-phosphopantetheinyl transferase
VQDVPDWDRVALDYLGPQVRDMLAGLDPACRADAFAQAWTRREAQLKCLGLSLSEFIPLTEKFSEHLPELPCAYAGALVTEEFRCNPW